MALVFLLGSAALHAQSYQGGVRGVLVDAAGGALANAKVTLTDQSTNVARTTLSSASGEYIFTAVDPATYSLTAESPGFKKLERKGVIVGTQQFLDVELKLEIGEVTDSVQVTEEVPLIENANASNGQVLDRQKLIDLPILGRNPFLFSKLAPGVVPVGDPRFNRFQDQSGSSQISIAGGPVRGNNYLLDGVPITDFNNRAVIIPSIEATQEVKLQNNTYDAEMGRTGGGVFNTYLKSGTNQFHGSLFGYTRQTDWLANNFFLNASGTPRPQTPFYNWGGSFGGPIWIPKVYNGKNRTFFWIADESYRQKSPLGNNVAVPTALERAGNFSQSKNAAGLQQVIYDPLTSVQNSNGSVTRQPFSGNILPASRLNPVALNVVSQFPLPSFAPSQLGGNDYAGSDVLTDRADEFTAKLDQVMFSWWNLNASYLHYKSREPSGNILQTFAGSGSNLLYRKVDAFQLNNVFTPNPTTVVSIRYGFNRFPNLVAEINQGFNPSNLGFSPNFTNGLQSLFFPEFSFQNFAQLGDNSASQSVYWSKNLLGSVAKYIGRHSLKMGFDYRLLHVDFTDLSNASGLFSFDDTFTRADPTKAAAGTGSDLAALLLGYPSSGTAETSTKLFTYVRYYAGYIHDDFRFNSKLTFNMGLRYEYETGIAETQNRYAVGFDRTVVSPLAANVTGVLPRGGVEFAGQNGYPTHCCNNGKTNFAPRFGIAYTLNDKTIIRGGYGLFYAPTTYAASASLAPGYTNFTPVVQSNDGNLTPATNLTNPFPAGLQQPTGNTLGYLQGVGSSLTVIDQNRGIGMVSQYSVDVQRELPLRIALEAGFVGSTSRNLQPGSGSSGTTNINQLEPRFLSLGNQLRTAVPNPFYQKGGTGVIGGPTISESQLLRDYPQFSAVNLYGSSSSAQYEAFFVKAQKRYAQGVTFLATYTWSRNMDSTFAGPGNFLNSSSSSAQDIYNLGAEYSRAVNDVPSRFTASGTYDLPFGMGQKYLNSNRTVDYVVGNWQLNVITSFQTGFPLAITQSSNNNSIIGAGLQRPNATGLGAETPGSLETRLGHYLDPLAFSPAPAFTFGNVSRTIPVRGPGQANWDISLFKTVKIKELFSAQFRLETLNTFNTPLFRGPNTAYGSANFGKITQQANFPRYLQLGARFFF